MPAVVVLQRDKRLVLSLVKEAEAPSRRFVKPLAVCGFGEAKGVAAVVRDVQAVGVVIAGVQGRGRTSRPSLVRRVGDGGVITSKEEVKTKNYVPLTYARCVYAYVYTI